MERRKRIIYRAILFCCLMVLTVLPVKAAEATGSVTIQFSQEAAGVNFTLYQVAEQGTDGLNFTEAFANSGVTLEKLSGAEETQQAADALAACAAAQTENGQTQMVKEDGTVTYLDLVPGVYLAVQNSGTETVLIQNMLFAFTPGSADRADNHLVLTGKSSFPGGAVILNKTDEKDNVLQGAKFLLEVQTDGQWKELKTDLITDQNGQIVVTDLSIGSYRFRETEAPKGYLLLEDPVPFEITKAGQVAAAEGRYQKASGEVAELTVINVPVFPNGFLYDTTPTPGVEATPAATPTPEPTSQPASGENNPSGGNPDGGSTSQEVKTGDDTRILPFVILLLSAMAVTAAVICRKEKN